MKSPPRALSAATPSPRLGERVRGQGRSVRPASHTTESLENTLCSVIKTLAAILPLANHEPIVLDHLYCGKMFLHEAAKAAMGHRVRSSRTLALALAPRQTGRLRLYRRFRSAVRPNEKKRA